MPRYLLFPLALLAIWLEMAAGGFTKDGPYGDPDGSASPGSSDTVLGDDGPFGDPNG